MLFIIGILAILVMGFVLALGVLYPSGVSQAQSNTQLTISASGTSYASPQAATLYVFMNGSGQSPSIAASNLSTTLNEFNYTISKYIGGNTSKITTQSYSLQKVYNSSQYQATELVSVSIQIDNVSPLLSVLSSISNVYINSVNAQLTSQQISALGKSALALAMQNATSQAQVLAGNSTLMIRNVSAYSAQTLPYPVFASGPILAANSPSARSNQIYFNGRQGVQETVTVVFGYKSS